MFTIFDETNTSTKQDNASQSITNAGGKTTLALTNTAADTGITIGGDTNLYRPGANELKTDDVLSVDNNLFSTGRISTEGAADNDTRAALDQSAGG